MAGVRWGVWALVVFLSLGAAPASGFPYQYHRRAWVVMSSSTLFAYVDVFIFGLQEAGTDWTITGAAVYQKDHSRAPEDWVRDFTFRDFVGTVDPLLRSARAAGTVASVLRDPLTGEERPSSITVDLTWSGDGPVVGSSEYTINTDLECVPEIYLATETGRLSTGTGNVESAILGGLSGASSYAFISMGLSEGTGCIDASREQSA